MLSLRSRLMHSRFLKRTMSVHWADSKYVKRPRLYKSSTMQPTFEFDETITDQDESSSEDILKQFSSNEVPVDTITLRETLTQEFVDTAAMQGMEILNDPERIELMYGHLDFDEQMRCVANKCVIVVVEVHPPPSSIDETLPEPNIIHSYQQSAAAAAINWNEILPYTGDEEQDQSDMDIDVTNVSEISTQASSKIIDVDTVDRNYERLNEFEDPASKIQTKAPKPKRKGKRFIVVDAKTQLTISEMRKETRYNRSMRWGNPIDDSLNICDVYTQLEPYTFKALSVCEQSFIRKSFGQLVLSGRMPNVARKLLHQYRRNSTGKSATEDVDRVLVQNMCGGVGPFRIGPGKMATNKRKIIHAGNTMEHNDLSDMPAVSIPYIDIYDQLERLNLEEKPASHIEIHVEWGKKGLLSKLIPLWLLNKCPIDMNTLMRTNRSGRRGAALAFYSLMELNKLQLIQLQRSEHTNEIRHIEKSTKLNTCPKDF